MISEFVVLASCMMLAAAQLQIPSIQQVATLPNFGQIPTFPNSQAFMMQSAHAILNQDTSAPLNTDIIGSIPVIVGETAQSILDQESRIVGYNLPALQTVFHQQPILRQHRLFGRGRHSQFPIPPRQRFRPPYRHRGPITINGNANKAVRSYLQPQSVSIPLLNKSRQRQLFNFVPVRTAAVSINSLQPPQQPRYSVPHKPESVNQQTNSKHVYYDIPPNHPLPPPASPSPQLPPTQPPYISPSNQHGEGGLVPPPPTYRQPPPTQPPYISHSDQQGGNGFVPPPPTYRQPPPTHPPYISHSNQQGGSEPVPPPPTYRQPPPTQPPYISHSNQQGGSEPVPPHPTYRQPQPSPNYETKGDENVVGMRPPPPAPYLTFYRPDDDEPPRQQNTQAQESRRQEYVRTTPPPIPSTTTSRVEVESSTKSQRKSKKSKSRSSKSSNKKVKTRSTRLTRKSSSVADSEEPSDSDSATDSSETTFFTALLQAHQQKQQQPSYANSYNNNYEAPNSGYSYNDNNDRSVVHKHVFVHAAPETYPQEPRLKVIRPPVAPEKHVQIIFVKSPTEAPPTQTLVELPAPHQTKTVVYVLSKKPENAGDNVKVIRPPPSKPHAPEIYFIRYGDRKSQEGYPDSSLQSVNLNENYGNAIGAPDSYNQLSYLRQKRNKDYGLDVYAPLMAYTNTGQINEITQDEADLRKSSLDAFF